MTKYRINEIFFSDVRVPDANRLGAEGDGWSVAITTLMNERNAIGTGSGAGSGSVARRGAAANDAVEIWRQLDPSEQDAARKVYEKEGIRIPKFLVGKNIIHLPTVKTHIFTTTTGAMKNAFGGLLNEHRHWTHPVIHETLVDLLSIQKKIHSGLFAVMDGTFAGDGPGPRCMLPHVKNVILASADQVAIDAVSASLMGFDPMEVRCIRLADERGLGVGRLADIEIVGDEDAAAPDRHGVLSGDRRGHEEAEVPVRVRDVFERGHRIVHRGGHRLDGGVYRLLHLGLLEGAQQLHLLRRELLQSGGIGHHGGFGFLGLRDGHLILARE